MENNEITVVLEHDLILKNKNQEIRFESNKEHQVNKEFFQSLSIRDLGKLTPESFWQNIKFIDKNYLIKMNKVRESGSGLAWPPSNKCFELLVDELGTKHVNAAFEYLKAKNREEVKNKYKQWRNWIKDNKLKSSLDVGKDKLKLLYPEKKDYFDGLSENKLQQEIDGELLLGTQYDEELKYGVVLDYKYQAPQVQKITEKLEDKLYTQLLNIDKDYIEYFSPDFLYRKIILEKSNDGKLNDFQEAFIRGMRFHDYENIIHRVKFGFKNFECEEWFSRGWEFYKFLLEHEAKSVIEKVQLGQYKQIGVEEIYNLTMALRSAYSYLKEAPKDIMYKIIFHNGEQNTIDLTIKKIADSFSSLNFMVHWFSRSTTLGDASFSFFEKLCYLIIDEETEKKEGKIENLQLDDDHKKNLLWLLSSCPYLMNKCVLESFVIDNLNDENVWYAFCNFDYEEEKTITVLEHFINNDKELINIIEGKPDILHYLGDKNKKNCEFIYPLITKLILKRNRSVLRSLRFMKNSIYNRYSGFRLENISYSYKKDGRTYYFWKNYFVWLEKNLGTENFLTNGIKQNLMSEENNKNIEDHNIKINGEQKNDLIEINPRVESDKYEKNNPEEIILIDKNEIDESEKIDEIKIEGAKQIETNQLKSINENDLKKIILTRRYIGNGYLFYQEDYWNVNTDDFSIFLELLKERDPKPEDSGFEKSTFFQIEVLRQKYVKDNNLKVDDDSYANMPPQHKKKMKKFDQLIKFESGCSYRWYALHGYKNFFEVIQDIEECDPNYQGLRKFKSYWTYTIIIHYLINIAIVLLFITAFFILCTFLNIYLAVFVAIVTLVVCPKVTQSFKDLIRKDYTRAEKLYLNKRLSEYDDHLLYYRHVTDYFESFIDGKLCFIGNDIWNEIKNYFKNNVSTLESELKKYRKIDDVKKITLDDVYKFYWKRNNKLISDINKIYDDALDKKVNEINIDEISCDFRNYVNRFGVHRVDACEKFINKNIVGHLDNIKEMLKIKGRCAYFRYKPNTNEKLIQYDISLDLSELLWKILKEEHEKDKNIQKDNLSTETKNESVNNNKPIVEDEEEEK